MTKKKERVSKKKKKNGDEKERKNKAKERNKKEVFGKRVKECKDEKSTITKN